MMTVTVTVRVVLAAEQFHMRAGQMVEDMR